MGKTVTTDTLPAEVPPIVDEAPEGESLVTDTLVTSDLNDLLRDATDLTLGDGEPAPGATYTVTPKTGRHVQINGKVIPLVQGTPIQVNEQAYRFLLGLDEVDAVDADKNE